MAHLVAMEVPSNATIDGTERLLLRLVRQIMAAGPQVAVIVVPQVRRQAQTMIWVHRWNRLEHAPFTFHRTCSCCVGNSVPGLHAAIYLGRSFGSNGDYAICDAVPSTGMTPQAANRLLAGVVGSLLPVPWELAASDSDQVRALRRVPNKIERVHAHGPAEPRCSQAPAQWVPDSSLDGPSKDSSPDGPLPSHQKQPPPSPQTAKNESETQRTYAKLKGSKRKRRRRRPSQSRTTTTTAEMISRRSAQTSSW